VSRYGLDLGGSWTLARLAEAAAGVDGIERVRLVTSHPRDVTVELLDAIARVPELCESLHMPAQAGSNRVLDRMGRGYTRERYLEVIAEGRARVDGMTFTSDFIVGFPGETPDEFELTLALVREARFRNVFAFTYNPRPGTGAASFTDNVSPEEKKRRHAALLALQESISADVNRGREGTVLEVLAEGPSKRDPSRLVGRSRFDEIVVFEASESVRGRLVDVEITGSTPLTLFGRMIRRTPTDPSGGPGV
jgi:tRNA-2-methylthio-N6-dimethylallyladenosine synthase